MFTKAAPEQEEFAAVAEVCLHVGYWGLLAAAVVEVCGCCSGGSCVGVRLSLRCACLCVGRDGQEGHLVGTGAEYLGESSACFVASRALMLCCQLGSLL